jgi:cytochrome c-type biogenesis protein CcmH/NrfG
MAPFGLDAEEEADERAARARADVRRVRFTRYVAWTVGACVALCVAGVARRFVADRAAMADESAGASSAFTVAAAAPPSTTAAVPTAVAPAAAAPASAPPDAARDAKEAKREKKVAQRALERGKLDAAITSATQAVTLDPTDAESWLVLGAAYMEKHDTVSARHAFTSCTTTATHGPKKECASMLR